MGNAPRRVVVVVFLDKRTERERESEREGKRGRGRGMGSVPSLEVVVVSLVERGGIK